MSKLDRFDLAKDAISKVAGYEEKATAFVQEMDNMLAKHTAYVHAEGKDLPEVTNWKWTGLK